MVSRALFILKAKASNAEPPIPAPLSLQISGSPEYDGVVNEAYAGILLVASGTFVEPLFWGDLEGEPSGLVLTGNGQSALINGTPIQAGSFTISTDVTDSSDPPQVATAEFGFTVDEEAPSVGDVTSISQFGIAINFDEPVTVGQHANGDYWVVTRTIDPPNVSSTSPASQSETADYTMVTSGSPYPATGYANRKIHGMQRNPGSLAAALAQGLADNSEGSRHGIDSLNQTDGLVSATWLYDDAQNIDPGNTGLPTPLTEGTYVKAKSRTPINNDPGYLLTDQIVFTALNEAPAAGAFRAAPAQADKAAYTYNKSHIDYSVLQSLTPPTDASIPDLAVVKTRLRRYFQHHVADGLQSRTITAVNNQPDYGQDISMVVNDGLLSLHLDYSEAEKEELAIYVCQYGLDVIARVEAGAIFPTLGGGNQHRKAAAVMTACLLRNAPEAARLLAQAQRNDCWSEDGQTFTVPETLLGVIPSTSDGRTREPYLPYMVGAPEWREGLSANKVESNWALPAAASYRHICGSQFTGAALSALLTEGGKAAWNHQEFFDYADRYFMMQRLDPQSGFNPQRVFHSRMYEEYRELDSGDAEASNWGPAEANGAYVWREASDLLDFHTTPTASDLAVTVGGSPVTVSSVIIYGKRLVAVVATPLTGGETVTVAYTQGINKLQNRRLVDLPSFTATAATNTTGILPAAAASPEPIRNWDGAAATKARSKVSFPVSQDTGICKIMLVVRTNFRTAPVAGANIVANGSASAFRHYPATSTNNRLIIGSTSICTISPSTAGPSTGWVTNGYEANFTQALAADGKRYMRDGDLVAPASTVWDSQSGARTFSMATILAGGLGAFGRADGSGTLPDIGIEFIWMHWATADEPWTSLEDGDVRAGFVNMTALGDNGEGPLGYAPKLFYPMNMEEANSDGGIANRGTAGFKPLIIQQGEFSLVL